MRKHLKKILKELNIYLRFYQLNCIANSNDVFFKIRIVDNEEEISSITGCIINKFTTCFN